MSDDLIDRLRAITVGVPVGFALVQYDTHPDCAEAADRIEALTAELAAERETSARLSHAVQVEGAAAVDDLRIKAAMTNREEDKASYLEAAAKWFNDRHFRVLAALTPASAESGRDASRDEETGDD